MLFHKLDRYRDFGLFVLRVGIGVMFILHGYPKLIAGQEMWAGLGGALSSFGLTLNPTLTTVMGFFAALSETGGGLLLLLGLFTRPACLALLSTMVVATVMHIKKGDGIEGYSHALEAAILFFSFLFMGPGKWSVDTFWSNHPKKKKISAD